MTNEVIDLLTALRDGTTTLGEVADQFRNRSWPRRDDPDPVTFLELAARAQEDPDPYIPGSFDDVAAAFHRGELTNDQYEVLAEAMAESMRAEDQRRAGSPDSH